MPDITLEKEAAQRLQTTALRFYPVSLTRAHEEVVAQIVYAIRSGKIAVGERLPTIEDLADMTAVSKPVIGEAVRVLREHGVLETKRGVQGGVTVVSDEIPTTLLRLGSDWRKATLTELVEARGPIELELAQLAGVRGTEAEFASMHDSLARLREAHTEDSKGSFLRFDHLFHYQIGRAAKSEKLAQYQHRILNEVTVILHEYDLFHEDRDFVVRTHEAILTALEKRDSDLIREAVDAHWRTSSGAFADIEELGSERDQNS